MSYTAPSAGDVRTRFEPKFDDVSDGRINALIAEALRVVDETWTEGDYATAIMYWVAHSLVTEGALDEGASASTTGLVQSETLGDASVTYWNRSAGAISESDTQFMTTVYGARFLELRRANVGGPIVV